MVVGELRSLLDQEKKNYIYIYMVGGDLLNLLRKPLNYDP